jgi:hypothetical protein
MTLRVIIGFVVAYVVEILTLGLSRLDLHLPAEIQVLLPAAASLLHLYIPSEV